MATKQRGLKPGEVKPGDVVRLTGYFLKCTGQVTGSEGSKRWTVRACACELCTGGDFVCTDEEYDREYRADMWGDLPEDERPKYRHVNRGNLQRVGSKPRAADQPEECP